MALSLLIGRLLLAAVLGVAGVAKIADLAGSRQAMLGFGVPARLAAAFGLALPIAELAVAAMLLITPLAWWGTLGALLLLVGFIIGIAANLARGRTPDCHCFGQLHSEPIGWQTLARNAILAIVALWIVALGPARVTTSGLGLGETSAITWIALTVSILSLALAALAAWFVMNLLQQNGRLLLRIEALEAGQGSGAPVAPTNSATVPGLRVGSPAPPFSLAGLHGETLTLDSLRVAQKPLLLLFVDPNCAPCKLLLPEVARWQRDHATQLTVVPISRGKAEANQTEQGLQTVLLQKDFEVAKAYQVTATPSAVLVRADGTVGSPLAAGPEAIRALLHTTVGLAASVQLAPTILPAPNGNGNGNGTTTSNRINLSLTTRLGDPAPTIQLPDLSGNRVDFATFTGHAALLIFWNPGCGYCRQMLDDLKAIEANPPQGAPTLFFISTGTPEANRAMNLNSPTVLDPDFSVARTFGARGTPSAILVDAEGRVASEIAVGKEAVLSLARGGVQLRQGANG